MAETQNRFTSGKTLVVARLIAILGLTTAATTAATTAGASQSTEAGASHGTLFHRTELYFGRDRPGGEVSEEEFAHFVDVEVTKRFPDGLTLLSGLGQFQDESGQVVKEKSKLLILLYPLSDRQADREIEDIRTAYKVQFQQTSVLRVDTMDRVSF
jgi:hypothetical protein